MNSVNFDINATIDKTTTKTKNKHSQNKKTSKNNNFLELLLKAKDRVKEKTNSKNSLNSNNLKKEKEAHDSKKELNSFLMHLLTEAKEGELKTTPKIPKEINFDKKIVQEIRNIIISTMRLKNRVLEMADIKKLKNLKSVTELIKFANKKGLNIKKIAFKLAENLEKKPRLLNSIKNSVKTSEIVNKKSSVKKIATAELISTKKKVEKKLELNQKNNSQMTISHRNKEKVDLVALLNKDKKEDRNFSKHSIQNNDKTPQLNSNISINEIKARQFLSTQRTIESFKHSLDDAIKNYKPPISKVEIELNPKNLGKVEVTIIQRGDHIKIQMNSNQNNLVLFQAHQTEFRQALANIGFTNIDMSFNSSSNQERERKEQEARKNYKNNEKIDDVSEIEIEANYRYA